MKVLAIDTSNHPMSVALVEDEQLLATTTLNMVRNHSIYLMPTIDNLFKLVQWTPADLDPGTWFVYGNSDCRDDC